MTLPARVSAAPLSLDAPLVPEAAGGPVLDADGRLVGIGAADGGTIAWDAVKRRIDELSPGRAACSPAGRASTTASPGCTGSPAKPTPTFASSDRV